MVKARTSAAELVESGHVRVNGARETSPGHDDQCGDLLARQCPAHHQPERDRGQHDREHEAEHISRERAVGVAIAVVMVVRAGCVGIGVHRRTPRR